jgi:hypothetical protein
LEAKLAGPSAGEKDAAPVSRRLVILNDDVGENSLSIEPLNTYRAPAPIAISMLHGEVRDREINRRHSACIHFKDAVIETRSGINNCGYFVSTLNGK